PLFFEVSVSVTLPAVISAALGTYVAASVVALGENVPVPLVLHCADPVVHVPLNLTESLFAQTVWLLPAFTTAGLFITTVTLPTGPVQPAAEVAVTEYVPALAVVTPAIEGF